MSVWPEDYDAIVTTVGIGLEAYFFPFFKGLNWLYMGFGSKCDFLMGTGSDVQKDDEKNSAIFLFPQIGFRQNIKDFVIVDISYGYNIEVSGTTLPAYEKDLVKHGSQLDAGVKINLSKIIFH